MFKFSVNYLFLSQYIIITMNKENKINSIKEKGSSETTNIWYQGKQRKMKVYEVDISLLRFNFLNGRIASEAMEYSSTEGIDLSALNPEEANALISEWIWQKSEAANINTKADFLTKGQMRPGVITRDGILVDGNRRFMIVRKLNNEGHNIKFKTIILDEAYSDGGVEEKDIKSLEALLQLGEDKKVDYSPIEKYLVVMDFVDNYVKKNIPSMTYEQVADLLKMKNKKDVEKNYRIAKLMMQYLSFIDAYRMPSRLNNTEDLFINLENNIHLFKGQKGKISWSPDDDDINDYKTSAFNLIRWVYNQNDKGDWDSKSLREIFFRNSEQTIFSNENVWEKFNEKITELEDIPVSLDDYKSSGLSHKDAKHKVDINWADNADDIIKSALGQAQSKLHDKRNHNQPKIYLRDALNKLENLIREDEFEANGTIKFKPHILDHLQDIHEGESNHKIADKIRKIAEYVKRRIKS